MWLILAQKKHCFQLFLAFEGQDMLKRQPLLQRLLVSEVEVDKYLPSFEDLFSHSMKIMTDGQADP